jgi:hypothetical protein
VDEPLIEVTLPAPVEEVWRHLREPEAIARWFGWEYEGLAGEIDLIFFGPSEDTVLPEGFELPEGAGVRADDEAHVLEIDYGEGSLDRFAVDTDGDGARLSVTRTVAPDSWDGVFDDLAEGWIAFVQQLRFLLERHPGEERRTVFVGSTVTVPKAEEALAGLTTDGEPWYRTEHQAGVVDPDGHLRLVLRARDAASLTITAYGLDDAAVADLTGHWSAWWVDHVGTPDPGSPPH